VIRFKTHTAMLHMVDEIAHKRRFEHPRTVFDEMLTDRGWITDGLKRFAPGVFSEREVATIHRWCSDQFFLRDDAEDATDGEKPCLDREDDTILLRLYQVMKGPLSFNKDKRLLYDHIMVDEAQDLSPIELAVVIDTAGSRASVTLAGDVVQKVNELRDFQDWTQVLDALQLQHVNVSPLQVSYRATRPIMEVARHILGHLAPEEPLVVPRDGAPVAHLRFQGMGEATTWLAPALTELINREPTAYVALLTSSQAEASAWYQVLDRSEVPHIRLVDDQDFSFQPGIEVTDIRSSKGLEFDYVLILGADAVHFPNNDSARHMLHVGATRGAHQLWFISSGPPTPLLPDTLSGLEI